MSFPVAFYSLTSILKCLKRSCSFRHTVQIPGSRSTAEDAPWGYSQNMGMGMMADRCNEATWSVQNHLQFNRVEDQSVVHETLYFKKRF